MLANAIRLATVLGNPFERHPPSDGRGPTLLPELEEKFKGFWASKENYNVHLLPRDPKIPMDFTLEIRVPKRDTQIVAGGCSLWPSSQISARDIDPWLTEQQIQEIAWREIRSLRVAADGPNRYDRNLMAIRKIVAKRTPDRRRLLNGQVDEFLAKCVMPYGPRLGRWYFTRKVLDESRRVLRKLGLLGGVVGALRAISRWIAGRG